MKISAIFLQAQIKLQLAWTVTQRDVLQSEHAVVQSVCSVTGVPLAGTLYAVGHRSSAAPLNFDLYICIHVHFCKVCSTVYDGNQFTSNITWLRNVNPETLNSRNQLTSPVHVIQLTVAVIILPPAMVYTCCWRHNTMQWLVTRYVSWNVTCPQAVG